MPAVPSVVIEALWGLLGAFMYAGPKFLVCRRDNAKAGTPMGRACRMEVFVALAIGGIAAGAFSAWIGGLFGRTGEADLRAIATLIGLAGNRAAPKVAEELAGVAARLAGRVSPGVRREEAAASDPGDHDGS